LKVFKSSIYLIIAILCIYIVINYIVLLWDIIKPDGFWGFVWFYFILLLSISAFLTFIVWVLTLLSKILSENENTGPWWLFIILPLFSAVGAMFYYGPTMLFYKGLKDKYLYVEQSEMYFEEGKYNKALDLALEIYEKANNRKKETPFFIFRHLYRKTEKISTDIDYDIYEATYNYAHCLQASGKEIQKAERLFNECVLKGFKYVNENEDRIVESLLGLLKIYIANGDRRKADICFQFISTVLFFADKSNQEYNIEGLNFYAEYADFNGDFEKGADLRKQALDLHERINGKKNQELFHLRLLIDVASDKIVFTNAHEAGTLILEAESIAEDNDDNAIYLDFLQVKAKYLELINDSVGAENTYLRLLTEIEDRQGENHIQYSKIALFVAEFYFRHFNFSEADKYLNKALRIVNSKKTEEKTFYYSALLESAISDMYKNDFTSAKRKNIEIENFLNDQINLSFGFMTEEEKETYIVNISKKFDLINSIYIGSKDSIPTDRIYNNIISTKSIAFQSNQYIQQVLKNCHDDILIRQYQSIQKEKRALYKEKLYGSRDKEALIMKEVWIKQREQQFVITLFSKKILKGFYANSIHWEDIRNSLKENEAAIEYFKIPIRPGISDEMKYYSLIIKHDSKTPILIPLFDEKTIQKIIEQKGTTKDQIDNIYTNNSLKGLYKYIWLPIKQQIRDCNRAYVSLTGMLYQISFPAITIDEDCSIVFLSSTRRIADSLIASTQNNSLTATLFGDINYSYCSKIQNSLNSGFGSDLKKLVVRDGYQNLPSTKIEIGKIETILKKKHYSCQLISGNEATEQVFKIQVVKKPNILHIATHGFYYPPKLSYQLNELLLSKADRATEIQNPLYRSGLLFAGVNNQNYNFKNSEDGVLTAYEISQLDLNGVDMVVLSACETGLGDIKGSEGVFGLQRAFKLAGASTIVISLWKVPDTQTSELMQSFYKYYFLGKGYSKQGALKAAQKDIRQKYPNPYYWAAFVVID